MPTGSEPARPPRPGGLSHRSWSAPRAVPKGGGTARGGAVTHAGTSPLPAGPRCPADHSPDGPSSLCDITATYAGYPTVTPLAEGGYQPRAGKRQGGTRGGGPAALRRARKLVSRGTAGLSPAHGCRIAAAAN